MSDRRFLPKNDRDKISHLVEECGEVVAAAGKTLRFGLDSYNPLLPIEEQELNRTWLRREIRDLKMAIKAVEKIL